MTAHCSGGLYEAGDRTDQTTPNTQYATYRYADGTEIHCDLRNWFSGPPEAQGVLYLRQQGLDEGRRRQSGGVFWTEERSWPHADRRPGRPDRSTREGQAHFENFIECVRSRKSENLKAPLVDGHFSTTLCHLGNISYRVGRSVKFDGARERFEGDEEADKLLGRTYRAPYLLPDKT